MTAAGPAQPVTRSRLRAALAAHGVAATEQMLTDIVAAMQPEATNAVEAYRAAFGKYPAKVFWDSMNQAVGERVQEWEAHCQWWMARGYRPNNYDGLFTSFKEGKTNGVDQRRITAKNGNEVGEQARADARRLTEISGGVSEVRPQQISAPF